MTESELQKTIETTQPVKQEPTPAPQEQSFDPLNPFLTILNLLNRPRNYLSAAPTFVPQNFVDQFQFVDDGVDKWLYVYFNKVWVGIKDGSGGGGSPGGSNKEAQYNNTGVFGGIPGARENSGEMELDQPIINDFTDAQHDHSNGSQGGQLNASSVFNAGKVPVARLPIMLGDGGSGGTEGLVPTPAAGDGTKYLRGDGTWETPPTAGFDSRVSVYSTSNQSTSLAPVTLNLDTVIFDDRGEFDISTHKFTADDSGFYLVNYGVLVATNYNRADSVALLKNSLTALDVRYFTRRTDSVEADPFAFSSCIVELAAGDTLELSVNIGGSRNILGGINNSYMQIHRLS
jgi:hypothetical protein